MATTKIWAIKGKLSTVLNYASNPEKTTLKILEQVLKYATNEEKTNDNMERRILVTGVNCNSKTALKEMQKIKEKYNKVTGGNTAYHAYQSFKTGEVSGEEAHKIGLELAQKMWAEYQVVVATHLNTGTYHNHFVINSVNMFTGEKFNCNKGAYYRFRGISDELCKKHNLVVIKNPKGRTPRDIYFAEKRGEPTKYNLMRKAIDEALSISTTMAQFKAVMYKMGYEIEGERYLKYPTIRSINSKKATRLNRLGEKYTIENINKTLLSNPLNIYDKYREYMDKPLYIPNKNKTIKYKEKDDIVSIYENIVKELIEVLLYFMGYRTIEENNNLISKYEPLSPEMKEAKRKMKTYSKRAIFMDKEKINTEEDLDDYIKIINSKINKLKDEREKIRNKLRNCKDEERTVEYKKTRDELTANIKDYREKYIFAIKLKEDIPRMKELVKDEITAINREEERIKRLEIKKTERYIDSR